MAPFRDGGNMQVTMKIFPLNPWGGEDVGSADGSAVARHSSAPSCWVIIRNRVYDVTAVLAPYPGGAAAVLHCGRHNATAKFGPVRPPGTLEEALSPAQPLGPSGATTAPYDSGADGELSKRLNAPTHAYHHLQGRADTRGRGPGMLACRVGPGRACHHRAQPRRARRRRS